MQKCTVTDRIVLEDSQKSGSNTERLRTTEHITATFLVNCMNLHVCGQIESGQGFVLFGIIHHSKIGTFCTATKTSSTIFLLHLPQIQLRFYFQYTVL